MNEPDDIRRAGRPGFTMVEAVVALAALAVATVLAAQAVGLVLAQKAQAEARQEAGFAAENVLDAARALPWDDLTPEWAGRQKLPDHLAGRQAGGRLTATVELEPDRPRVKRVTVAVTWTSPGGQPARPVRLVGLFAARTGGVP